MEWSRLNSADNPGSLIHADALIHTPMATLLNLVAPSAALGAAEYAVDTFRQSVMLRKVKNTADTRQADSPLAQARFARAYGCSPRHGCIGRTRSAWCPVQSSASLEPRRLEP